MKFCFLRNSWMTHFNLNLDDFLPVFNSKVKWNEAIKFPMKFSESQQDIAYVVTSFR